MPSVSATSMKMIGSSLEVSPAVDRVHRLVLDELFQNGSGSAPVDALEPQEAAVEPRAQQMHEVSVDDPPVGIFFEVLQQPASHLDQRSGSPGGHVKPPEQLLAWRLHRFLQPDQIVCRRIRLICARGARYGVGRR
jgi:hypothetical protein